MRTIAALSVAIAFGAEASSYTRRASLAALDVPLAETVGRANATFGLEFFVERHRAGWGALPLPMSIVMGVGDDLDVGISAQFGGLPGDAAISPAPVAVLQWTVAAKYSLFRSVGWRPLVSLEAVLDRPTTNLRSALRAVVSSRPLGPFRATGFAGAEVGVTLASLAPTGGVAILARHGSGLEGLIEVLYSSRGWLAGAGVRWGFAEHVGASATATWIPQEANVRISLGLAVFFGEPALGPLKSAIVVAEGEKAGPAAAGPRKYFDDRPRLRLKIHQPRSAEDPGGRHYQYGPDDERDRADEHEAKPAPGTPSKPVPAAPPPPTPNIPPPTPEIPPQGGEDRQVP